MRVCDREGRKRRGAERARMGMGWGRTVGGALDFSGEDLKPKKA